MGKWHRSFLTALVCMTVVALSACGTTTHRVGPSQAALNHHGIEAGDKVLVRLANKDDTRVSNSSKRIIFSKLPTNITPLAVVNHHCTIMLPSSSSNNNNNNSNERVIQQ